MMRAGSPSRCGSASSRGLVLGVILAFAWPAGAPYVQFIGDLFVRAIRMLVAPIVLVTIAAGITSLADPKQLGSLGARTIGLFAATTAIAVSVGMLVASLIRPGVGAPLGTAAPHALGAPVTPYDQLIGIVPLNIVDALAKGDMLALIFVAILFGVGTVLTGEAGKPFASLLQSLSAVLLRVVGIVMEATPFGVFALIANRGRGERRGGVRPCRLARARGGRRVADPDGGGAQPDPALRREAAGAALLPRHHRRAGRRLLDRVERRDACRSRCASRSDNLGVARPVYSTVLPLGASIGKDGTAMYVGLLSMFALQAFGVPLTPQVYAHRPADRRARRVRHRAGALRLAVHARRRAVGGRRRRPNRPRWWSASSCRSTACST